MGTAISSLTLALTLLAPPPGAPTDSAPASDRAPSAGAPTGTVEHVSAIAGRITDATTGRPIHGALVLLHRDGDDSPREASTDEHGFYRILHAPPGTYELTVLSGDSETIRGIVLAPRTRVLANVEVGRRLVTAERMDAIHRSQQLRKAGIGTMAAGGVLAVGAILSAAVSVCGRDGAEGTDCRTDTRTLLTAGFGAASVATLVTGIGLYAAGKRNERGLYATATGDRHGGGLVVGGRF